MRLSVYGEHLAVWQEVCNHDLGRDLNDSLCNLCAGSGGLADRAGWSTAAQRGGKTAAADSGDLQCAAVGDQPAGRDRRRRAGRDRPHLCRAGAPLHFLAPFEYMKHRQIVSLMRQSLKGQIPESLDRYLAQPSYIPIWVFERFLHAAQWQRNPQVSALHGGRAVYYRACKTRAQRQAWPGLWSLGISNLILERQEFFSTIICIMLLLGPGWRGAV